MKIVDFRCPCCRGTDWLYISRCQRHFVRCQGCGQIRLLLIRPVPPRGVLMGLFLAADGAQREAAPNLTMGVETLRRLMLLMDGEAVH